jgi:hypothetical protein
MVLSPHPAPTGGAARDRHDTLDAGCDGREDVQARLSRRRKHPRGRRNRVVLIPRRWDQVRGLAMSAFGPTRRDQRATEAKEQGTPGRARISRNPSRRECRIASAEPVCSCAYSPNICTRDRGCSAHPAFPAPSVSRKAWHRCKTRVHLRRENAVGYAVWQQIGSYRRV